MSKISFVRGRCAAGLSRRALSTTASVDGSHVTIVDGENTRLLPLSWLWSNSEHGLQNSSGQRLRTPGDWSQWKTNNVVKGVEIIKPRSHCVGDGGRRDSANIFGIGEGEGVKGAASQDGSFTLKVVFEDGEVGLYPEGWIEQWSTKTTTTTTKPHNLSSTTELLKIPYKAFLSNIDNLFDCQTHLLHHHGAFILTDCPPTVDSILAAGKRLDNSETRSHGNLYGETFEVESKPDAVNIAYTDTVLPPHQDLVYYESPPGIQLLHASSFPASVLGGETMLIDVFSAAERFRVSEPDAFDVLTRTDATFVKQRAGGNMIYRTPHFRLSGNSEEVVDVRWSPPFEGPVDLGAVGEIEIDDYYNAYAKFERMIDVTRYPDSADALEWTKEIRLSEVRNY